MGGRVLSLAATLLAVALVGCSSKAPDPEKPLKTARLAEGARVELLLLRQLSAGGSKKDTAVPFQVAKDVVDGAGNVVIRQGTIAEGKVVWSRSEGTLSGMLGQPARLAVKFEATQAVDGIKVSLCASAEKPDDPYHFTQKNTGKPWERKDFDKVAESEGRQMLEAFASSLNQYLETGEGGLADGHYREWLQRIAQDPGMEALRRYVDSNALDKREESELGSVLRDISAGRLDRISGGEAMLAFSALTQLSRVVQAAEHSLSRRLKGRTIKAYIGTPASAYVSSEVTVRLSDG